jgi:hypothetical protein
MKNLIFLTFVLLLSSCVTKPVETPDQKTENTEEKPLVVKPSILKRLIKDFDLKKNQDDKSLKKRVVVLPFLDRNPDRPLEILKNAHTEFINQLNKAQDFIALDASDIKLDLAAFIKNGEYDLNAIAQASQNSGASSILEGKVIDLRFKNQNETPLSQASKKASFEIVVKARLINIRTGQELYNSVKTVALEEDNTKLPENIPSDVFFGKNPELVELLIKDAFYDFSTKLVEAMNQVVWEGRIAAFQGEKIYLNVGKISGVQVGDILKVVEDGNEVYDPEIGYHVGKVPGKVKGTLEVVGYFGQDGAISVVHSGAGFKENDRIELYE